MNIGTFIAIVLAFFIGYFLREFGQEEKDNKRKDNENENLQYQKQRYEKTKKAFDELMDYDYSKALGRDKDE